MSRMSAEHFLINGNSAIRIYILTTHFPFLFPFSRSSKPRSIREGVIRLTVRGDLPDIFVEITHSELRVR